MILAVGTLIGGTVIIRDRDIAYSLVLIWAYLGIWIKHTSADGFAGAYPMVIATVLVSIAAFAACAGYVLLRQRRSVAARG